MKSHLKLLRRFDGLAALLAIQSLFQSEGEFTTDIDGTGLITLSSPEDDATRVICCHSLDHPILSAKERDDGLKMDIKVVGPIQNYPPLTMLLAAMGGFVEPDTGTVRFQYREKPPNSKEETNEVEELWCRWSALDTMWNANRRLSQYIADGHAVIEKLVDLFHRAHQWASLREITFTREMSERETDKHENELERYRMEFAKTPPLVLAVVAKAELHEDPRAPSFGITFKDGAHLGFFAVKVDWAVAPVLGAGPKLPKSVSQGKFAIWAAAGFKDTLLRWSMKQEIANGNEKAIQPGVQG